MSSVVDFNEYRKKKRREDLAYRKSLVYLRPFDFDHIRYNAVIKKKSGTYKVTAYRNPIAMDDLCFDVYDESGRQVGVFLVTEEDNCRASNLDFHIWSAVDGHYEGNPVIEAGNFFEPGPDGKVNELDFADPWLKCNQGRYKVTTREEYEESHREARARISEMNAFFAKQRKN